jgi:hypothetical protein
MKAESLDKNLRYFTFLSSILVMVFLALLLLLAYLYSAAGMGSFIFLLLLLASILFTILLVSQVVAATYAYRRMHVDGAALWLVKSSMDFLFPVVLMLAGLFKLHKEGVRLLYIRVNNAVVESALRKSPPEQILLLLPHCLQDSECSHRITNNIGNCKRCGKCTIGEITKIAECSGICASVVTGGTAALNVVNSYKPSLILAVGCSRELVSGITEVRGIPVIGILNSTPNGPCKSTTVDVENLRRKLERVI